MKPQSKIVGGRRFSGYGKTNKNWDPAPWSVEWCKVHFPDRLNNTAINLSNGLGLPMDDFTGEDGKKKLGALSRAALVMSWSAKPLASMKFDNTKCTGCGQNMQHTDKPFPKWDKKMEGSLLNAKTT